MIDSDRGRHEAHAAFLNKINTLKDIDKFINAVTFDKPIWIHLLYHINTGEFHPVRETYVVMVEGFKTKTDSREKGDLYCDIVCKVLARKKDYVSSPYRNRGTGGTIWVNIRHLESWEEISDDEAPLYMTKYEKILEEDE